MGDFPNCAARHSLRPVLRIVLGVPEENADLDKSANRASA